jgi:K+-transporting ATPase ATPase C chain
MKTYLLPALRFTAVLLFICSGLYTLLVLGLARITPLEGKGEKITANGRTYYGNIGQAFNSERYFWSRPSAVNYNAAGSAGSNKGPSNPAYLADVQARIDTFMAHHPDVRKSSIPIDIVTASGSGLDPHISVQAARVQAERISRVRGIPKPSVEALIENETERPILGLFGPSRISVLKLNLALDELK